MATTTDPSTHVAAGVPSKLVRYSPDVDSLSPRFGENLEAVIDGVEHYIAASVATEGTGKAVSLMGPRTLAQTPRCQPARGKVPAVNLLLSAYWTMGAVRHGDYIAKVRIAPVPAFADRVVLRTMIPTAAPEVYRPALIAELKARAYEFDIRSSSVQISSGCPCRM